MTEMIERVARAIKYTEQNVAAFDYISIARAAIAAMREELSGRVPVAKIGIETDLTTRNAPTGVCVFDETGKLIAVMELSELKRAAANLARLEANAARNSPRK